MIQVRNPYSTRPYQHVLEPLSVYLMIAAGQYEDHSLAGNYNVGPDEQDCVTTGELADLFCNSWQEGAAWENCYAGGPHEAGFLKLDCSKIKRVFGWKPRWHVAEAVARTVEWSRVHLAGGDIAACMDAQIEAFFEG